MKDTATLFLSMMLIAATVVGVYAQTDGDGAVDGAPRNRGYGFLMLEEPISPRNAAMGSVGTALGGYGFRYYNPVQPFFLADISSYASAEFGRMPGGVNRGGIETAALFPEWFSAVSFFSSAVDFQATDERGPGAMASSGTTVGALSIGYIRGNIAAGVGLSMVEDRIWAASNYSAFALSLGLGYKALCDKLSLGAAWMNGAAWSRGFVGDGRRWQDGRVPVFARAGAAWADTLLSLPYTVAADLTYRDEDGTLGVPIGLEVKVLPSVSLRIGKRIGWETEIMSIGIGFNIDRLSFDATFVPTVFVDDYEMKWSMGFTYGISGGRRKKATVYEEEPVHIKATDEIEAGDAEAEKTGATDEKPVPTEEPAPPDEETVPVDESLPTDKTAPTNGTAPAEESAPADDSMAE